MKIVLIVGISTKFSQPGVEYFVVGRQTKNRGLWLATLSQNMGQVISERQVLNIAGLWK